MEMTDFNQRVQAIQPQLQLANSDPTDDNIANLVIAASLNGIAIMDCNKLDDYVPTPICSFFVYREIMTGECKTLYIFPADQPLPQ